MGKLPQRGLAYSAKYGCTTATVTESSSKTRYYACRAGACDKDVVAKSKCMASKLNNVESCGDFEFIQGSVVTARGLYIHLAAPGYRG